MAESKASFADKEEEIHVRLCMYTFAATVRGKTFPSRASNKYAPFREVEQRVPRVRSAALQSSEMSMSPVNGARQGRSTTVSRGHVHTYIHVTAFRYGISAPRAGEGEKSREVQGR